MAMSNRHNPYSELRSEPQEHIHNRSPAAGHNAIAVYFNDARQDLFALEVNSAPTASGAPHAAGSRLLDSRPWSSLSKASLHRTLVSQATL